MQDMNRRYENARKKSVDPYIRITIDGENYKISKRKLKQLPRKLVTYAIIAVMAFKVIGFTADKVDHYFETRDIAIEQSMEANSLLAQNDLNCVPVEDGYWRNDYSKIKGLDETDLYGFYQYCGYNESEEVVRALGYESWENYLSMKGYVDKHGQPSVAVWENYEEARLINEKREAKENGKNF